MATARDVNFGDAVVEAGLATREQADQCMAEMKQAESIGATVTLDAVMVKKGLLSRQQADEILESLARKKVPKRIAGFEVLETIAHGGMCSVFKARQISMDRIVALKVLSPKLASNKRYTERLFKEARAVAMLSHVNIIQGYDVGEASGYYYFAAEYVDGEPVAARLARDGKIREVEALNIVEQIGLALSHIHTTVNMVHGDIKPANIMLTRTGVAKLADLGLARVIGEIDILAAGTPHYISPEQARGTVDVDIRSDIYSLGATLFHMVTGVPPYAGTNSNAIIAKHLTAPIPSPKILTPELSPGICTLITTMLTKDRNGRYQTPDELLQDVRKVRAGMALPQDPRRRAASSEAMVAPPIAAPISRPIAPRPAPAAYMPQVREAFTGAAYHEAPGKQKKWLVPALVGAVIVLAAAVVAVVVSTRPPSAPPAQQAAQEKPPEPAAREKEATQAFATLQEFVRSNPSETLRVIGDCEDFAARWADTSYSEKAREMAKSVRARDEAEAEAEFQRLRAEAEPLVAEEHYSAALAVYGRFPKRFISDKWRRSVGDEVAALRKKAADRKSEVFEKAEMLARQGQYPEARKVLDEALKFGFKDVDKAVETEKAKYEGSAKQGQQTDLQRAQQAFDGLVISVANYERARSYGLATQQVDRYSDKYGKAIEKDEVLSEEFRCLKLEAESARNVWKDATAALTKAAGEPVELRAGGILLKGKVISATGDSFTLDINNNRVTKKLYDIEPDSLMQLVGLNANDEPTVVRRLLFMLASGEVVKAEAAAGQLPEGAAAQGWRDRIAKRKELAVANPVDEKPRSALDNLIDLVNKNKYRIALVGLYRFHDSYSKTEAFGELEAEYNTLREKIATGVCRDLNIGATTSDDFLAMFDMLRECVRWERENKCPKTKDCPNCNGKGYIPHPYQCPRCYGRGTISCPRCGGDGIYYGHWVRYICVDCLGGGRFRCGACTGRGVISRRDPCLACNRAGKDICPICNGAGYREPMPAQYEKIRAEVKAKYPRQADTILTLAKEE